MTLIELLQDPALAIPVYACTFILGLIIGSFLNVCICRIPNGRTVVKGRSYCPSCGALIPWFLNVPLVSWIALKGRCAKCGLPISIMYPAVEMLNAVLYVLILRVAGFSAETILLWGFVSLIIIIAFIDHRYQTIPARLLLVLLGLGAAYAAFGVLAAGLPAHRALLAFSAGALTAGTASLFLFGRGEYRQDALFAGAAGLFAGPAPAILLVCAAIATTIGLGSLGSCSNASGTHRRPLVQSMSFWAVIASLAARAMDQ